MMMRNVLQLEVRLHNIVKAPNATEYTALSPKGEFLLFKTSPAVGSFHIILKKLD